MIDRSRSLSFRFNGKEYEGHPGDTLASALMANGVRLVGRSFKYHRPRGIVAAGAEEPNAVVQLDGDADEPNARATTLELTEGLSARSVNCWPGVGFDLGAIADRLSPLLPAGFYYKTFMGFPGGWNFYGPLVRRMAGLGTAPATAGRHAYEKRFHHCDVLVAGAGPAGLQAAAGRGARRRPGDARRRRAGAGRDAARRRGGDRGASGDRVGGGRGGGARLPPRRRAARACHRGRLLRPQLPDRRRAGLDAALDRRTPVEGAGAARGAGHRRGRAAAGVCRQRPPGGDAPVRCARVRAPLRRAPRGPGGRGHQQQLHLSHRRGARRCRSRGAGARGHPDASARAARRRACRARGRGARRTRGGRRDRSPVRPGGVRRAAGPAARAPARRLRPRALLRWLEPARAPALAVGGASPVRRGSRLLRARRQRPGGAKRRGVQRRVRSAVRPGAGLASRVGGVRRAWPHRAGDGRSRMPPGSAAHRGALLGGAVARAARPGRSSTCRTT